MIVETQRFILRKVVIEDIPAFFELDSDPQVHKYLGNNPVKSIKESEYMVQSVINQYQQNGIGRWAIIAKNTKDFVGWCGLKYETKLQKKQPYYDLGYRLKKKYWGRGIATETALQSLKYGFEVMNLQEIFAAASIENVASNKILKKIGLTFINTFKYEEIPCNWYGIKKLNWQFR